MNQNSINEFISKKPSGIDMSKVVELVPKSQSPNNDDSGGFYLPDFISNEIEVKGSA